MQKFLRRLFLTLVGLVALAGALFAYFLYTPDAEPPVLTGKLVKGTIEAGGRTRSYVTYIPKDLGPGRPLVVVMHGSGGNGAQMRMTTGYGFELVADQRRFAVVYPDGFEGYWNACNIKGDYAANKLDIDDVGFLTALVDKLAADIGSDTSRVFATGLSRGGHMAFRLALEAPARFRAVAAIGANVPTEDNFKCKPAGQGTASVMIMNGTADPINPFNGGQTGFYGFIDRGTVKSSQASGQYFADLNGIEGDPRTTSTAAPAGNTPMQRMQWKNGGPIEIELLSHRGGHVVPQQRWRYPRILGWTPQDSGPAFIWFFFEQQPAR